MPFSVDPDTMQVAGRHRAVPFVMDWPGGGAVLSPDDDPCTVRRLGWGEKRALARFATAGAGFLERELVAICGSSGGPVSPDRHGAMLALTMWLDSPGGDALPFDATLLASASLKVAAATGLTLDALDARPACDVELLWRALETVPRGAAQSDLQPSAIDRPAHAADAFTHIVVLPDAHPSNVERSDSLVVPVRDAADARAPLEPVSSLPTRRGHSRDNRDAAAAVSRTAPSPKLPGTPLFRVLAPALPHADGEEKAAPDRSEPTPRRTAGSPEPAVPTPGETAAAPVHAEPMLRETAAARLFPAASSARLVHPPLPDHPAGDGASALPRLPEDGPRAAASARLHPPRTGRAPTVPPELPPNVGVAFPLHAAILGGPPHMRIDARLGQLIDRVTRTAAGPSDDRQPDRFSRIGAD